MDAKAKTRRMTMGGVCVALSVVSVMISSMIPGLELTFYGVSSIFTAVMIIESGLAGGALTYVASSLLCIMIVPNKIAVIPFIFFFGLYGFIKYFAERYRNPVGQIAVKVICFALIFGIAWFFFKALFFGNIVLPSKFPAWALAAAGLCGFILYDYIMTLIIKLYRSRIKHDRPKDIKLS
jgi:hypothetical protein